MKTRSLLTLALLAPFALGLAACGDDATAEATNDTAAAPGADAIDCPPLTVTIDGETVNGLDHAFAYSEPETGPGTGGFGEDAGKRYEIDGLFRAEYCGERVR